MPTRTPTVLDQISAEKTKISERLARLDADREKIATQLTDLETAERVLTRVGKTPPARTPRSARAAAANAAPAARGRGRRQKAAARKSAERRPSAPGLGERVLALAVIATEVVRSRLGKLLVADRQQPEPRLPMNIHKNSVYRTVLTHFNSPTRARDVRTNCCAT